MKDPDPNSLKQKLRSEFCDLLDRAQGLPKKEQRHLFWWCAKEALYYLGVVNGDIREI
jgi:hypothetical protein